MKVVLLNDTRDTGHFGCILTGMAYRELFDKHDIELLGTQFRKEPLDRKLCERADLVIVNGEGCIHDGNYGHLLDVGREFPSILTNAVFQNMPHDEYERLSTFKHVTVRESMSADYMSSLHGHTPEIVPDVVFSLRLRQSRVLHPRSLFISDDSRRECTNYTRKAKDPDFDSELLGSRAAAVGRFHGICLCAMAGIPFTVWPANTHKNYGIMHDMNCVDRHYDTSLEAVSNFTVDGAYVAAAQVYATHAVGTINDLYRRIAENRI